MPKITVSYRRADSDAMTGRIFDRLVGKYGKAAVFRDIDNIPVGMDFRKCIDQALAESDVLLVVVGPQWLGTGPHPRIQDEGDLVRVEVETALRREIPIIPVLVGGAEMPKQDDLPDSLKNFSFYNAIAVDAGLDFENHMDRLVRSTDLLVKSKLKVPASRLRMISGRRNWILGGFAVACAGLLGLAWMYYSASRQRLPVQDVARAPEREPAAQPMPGPQAPQADASAIVAAAACEAGSSAIFYDDFRTTKGGWDLGPHASGSNAYLADGQLAIKPSVDGYRWVYVSTRPLRNAAICVRVTSPTEQKNLGDGAGGIIFWARDNDNYHTLVIFPNGNYLINKSVRGTVTRLASGRGAGLKPGLGAVNDIKLVNRNDINIVYFNGVKAQESKGQPGKDDRLLGMIALSESSQQDEWRFSDFVQVESNLADELTDFGVKPQAELRKRDEIGTATPTTIPRGRVITTGALYDAIETNMIDGAPFVLVDALADAHTTTIRGAERIPLAGQSGSFDDGIQRQLSERLKVLTKHNSDVPIVFFCEGAATCWESYNASLRAIRLGYTRVYWYRGGLNAWKAAGLPMK